MAIIPNYEISGQSVTPEKILDIIPEQEASDRAVQQSEERYLSALEKNNADSLRNSEKMWSQLGDLSSTFGDILAKKQKKHREDREAQIKLDILTKGVSPELEAQFKGERSQLFDDDLATQEFASKYEAETGDSITAQEFRNMAGWEKYMVAEQYALQKAKDYDQYVYDAYETTKIDVVRDGQQVSVGHLDDLSPAEQAALDTKIKFEYAKQFAGLNEALVATVVKPEIDKFDELRRKKQQAIREAAYQIKAKESDDKMIEIGFVTANPQDGHQLAHDWAARYAARNRTTIQAGRIAFKESLIEQVEQNKITYPQAMSIVNHEIEARDGSMKTMMSWKEWDNLGEELAEASVKGSAARDTQKDNDINADLETIKSLQNPTNDQKAQLYSVFKQKYDGYVPAKLHSALQGHLDDDVARDQLDESIRFQGGVYEFDLANVSTKVYNEYKDKIISAGSSVPGTDEHKEANKWITSYTNDGMETELGETDAKSPEWLSLHDSLTELYFRTYKNTLYRDGQKVATEAQANQAAKLAVQQAVGDEKTKRLMMSTDFTDDGDETYNRMMQVSMTQAGGGNWLKQKITSNQVVDKELVAWYKTPLKQAKDLPAYYKDLAMRMGVNPIDLANSQIRFVIDEQVTTDKKDEKYNANILRLLYKFPTREKITRARLEAEGAGDQNAKTSIYNKKGLTITDE